MEGETEAHLARELGVSQATISRRKHVILEELRVQLSSTLIKNLE